MEEEKPNKPADNVDEEDEEEELMRRAKEMSL